MPLLTLFISLQVATPLVALMSFTISICILVRCWRDVVFSSAWKLIIATIIGIPIGLFYLKGSYDDVLKIVLALVILFFSIYKLAKPKLMRLRTERSSWFFGFFAGILGGAYNTNGPPVIIYGTMRKWTPAEFRATLQGYFLASNVFIMLGHWSAELWTSEVLDLFIFCLPFILLGIFLGSRLHAKIPKGRFEGYVYYLLIAISLVLLFQTAWSMVT
jgi:uncharacterized membrane protein YfcA